MAWSQQVRRRERNVSEGGAALIPRRRRRRRSLVKAVLRSLFGNMLPKLVVCAAARPDQTRGVPVSASESPRFKDAIGQCLS